MRITRKPLFGALLIFSMALAACSGLAGGGNSGSGSNPGTGGGATGPFSIGGTVAGLSGKGLVLQDNKGDNLTVNANGSFAFATKVSGAYSVSVMTQPTNPQQNCTVINASGTASAAVTNVQVSCTSGTVTIGGTVTGMTGSGLVLQNNAGDNLTVNANGAFTFATQLAIGAAYSVTVFTQPTNPAQACSVAAGAGNANSNVGTVVVTCAAGTLSIGGSVSGLAGTGMVLQDNGGDNLTIKGNGSFTFPTLLANGNTYSVTIQKQPTNPGQTCTVTNGSGTATANVNNIQIVCPAVFFTVGGQVVGLLGTNGGMVLQDNGGDNLPVTGNGPFTFVTLIAAGSSYDVSIFVGANTQPQGCIVWGFQGTANADVTSVTVDCGHNDWTWMSGNNTSNQFGTSGTPTPKTPPAPPTIDRDTPGGTRYPATWTDTSGNLWLFSGFGFSHDASIPNQPGFFQEMWKFTGTGLANYDGGFGNFWQQQTLTGSVPAPRWGAVTWTDGAGLLWLFGGQDAFNEFLNDLWNFNTATGVWTQVPVGGANLNGTYGTKGTGSSTNLPGGRWGATGRIDGSGSVWLFGGFGFDASTTTPGLLNDLWKFDGTNWTWVSGSNLVNPAGVYGTQGTAAATNVPGGRQASMSWIDNSGNFWLFGGFNLSGSGQPNAFNDLWEFTGGQWTWIAGASTVNQLGIYGTQGTAAAANTPGARWSSAAWTDAAGRLWLFGGQGFDATGNGTLSDVWQFSNGQWTWVKGPNAVDQAGVYGIQANPVVWPHVTNTPGARWAPGYWIDKSNQLWMFGGEGFDSAGTNGNGLLNDLWRYLPYP